MQQYTKRIDEMRRELLQAEIGLQATGDGGKLHTWEMGERLMKRGADRRRLALRTDRNDRIHLCYGMNVSSQIHMLKL